MLLGCIADDFTGATDLANNLVRAGMRVVQTIGVPTSPLPADCNAVVVALKSRTIAPADAVKQSLQALAWLQEQHVQQIYFKYCSTFDSWYSGDVRGNIGPVTEALMDALSCPFTIATPAFPDNQRTVFKGHLFVGDVLLSESGMKNHPLTPMRDANLVNVLQAQCQRKVGLIDFKTVALGAAAVTARVAELQAQGVSIGVVDALSNEDLYKLGPALKDMRLLTAGSGVAIALPANWGIQPSAASAQLPPVMGLKAIVSGSCSPGTAAQIAWAADHGFATLRLDLPALLRGGAAETDRLVDAAQATVFRAAGRHRQSKPEKECVTCFVHDHYSFHQLVAKAGSRRVRRCRLAGFLRCRRVLCRCRKHRADRRGRRNRDRVSHGRLLGLFAGRTRALQHHEGADRLARQIVRPSHHGGFGHQAHQAVAPAAVDQLAAMRADPGAHLRGNLGKFR